MSIPRKAGLRTDLKRRTRTRERGAVVRDQGLREAGYIRRLVEEHLAGRADHAHRLWPRVLLEAWIRTTFSAGQGPNRRNAEMEVMGGP